MLKKLHWPLWLLLVVFIVCTLLIRILWGGSPHHHRTPASCVLPFGRFHNRRSIPDLPRSFPQCSPASNAAQRRNSLTENRTHHRFSYTPARSWPLNGSTNVADVAVAAVLPLLGSAWTFVDQVAMVFPSWHRHFLAPTNTPLLILVDDAAEMPLSYLVAMLSLQPVNQTIWSCPRLDTLDLGYSLFEHRTGSLVSYVLIGNVSLPVPTFLRTQNRTHKDMVQENWHNPGCKPRDYFYIYGVTYYTYELLQLEIVDYFDYFWKIDYDVFFHQQVPAYHSDLVQHRPLVVYYNFVRELDRCLKANISSCALSYLELQQRVYCGNRTVQTVGQSVHWWFTHSFWGNLFLFWLGYYTAPEILDWSRYWNDFEFGKWVNRWGDQEYFLLTLGFVSTIQQGALRLPLGQYHLNDVEKKHSPFIHFKEKLEGKRKAACLAHPRKLAFANINLWPRHLYTQIRSLSDDQFSLVQNNTNLPLFGLVAYPTLFWTWGSIAHHYHVLQIDSMSIVEAKYDTRTPQLILRQVLAFGSCTGIYPRKLEWVLPPNLPPFGFEPMYAQLKLWYDCNMSANQRLANCVYNRTP